MSKNYSKKIRIGIFGVWGFGNMGDAAVADATIDGLMRQFPKAEIIAICQQPENSVLRHKIRSVCIFRTFLKNAELIYIEDNESHRSTDQEKSPLYSKIVGLIKRVKPLFLMVKTLQKGLSLIVLLPKEIVFSLEIFRTLRPLDLLVMSGSGQLNEEWGGPWHYPFGLFRWCVLARVSGCKIAFLSVAVGEITSFWSKYFCLTAIRQAHYLSTRDSRSKEIVETWVSGEVNLVPDMSFSIKFDKSEPLTNLNGSLVVGINPIAYGDPRSWNIPDQEKYNDYVEKLVCFCNWLIAEGHKVVFVPNDLLMDKLTIDDIIRNLDPEYVDHPSIVRPEVDNYMDVFSSLAECDAVLCCRFHGLIFSLMSNKPVIALAHHYKFFKLTGEMGQEKYCLDIDEFQTEELKTLFSSIVENKVAIAEEIRNCSAKYAELVENQYRKMIDIVQPAQAR